MKIIRLARTISDLSGHEAITNEAIWEASTMRRSHSIRGKKELAR